MKKRTIKFNNGKTAIVLPASAKGTQAMVPGANGAVPFFFCVSCNEHVAGMPHENHETLVVLTGSKYREM